jgi:hypothetical protein
MYVYADRLSIRAVIEMNEKDVSEAAVEKANEMCHGTGQSPECQQLVISSKGVLMHV